MKLISIKETFPSFASAIQALYQKGQGDETLDPIVKYSPSGHPLGRFEEDDIVIFYNLRGEREVELTQSLTEDNFNYFLRPKFPRLSLVTLVDYAPGLKVKVAFPSEMNLKNTLVEVVSQHGLKVLKIAESEKASHIGFFFNGKRARPFPKEETIIIPSNNLQSPENNPAMKAEEISQIVRQKIKEKRHDLIIVNLANVDVVGHYENKEAVLKAVEIVDKCLGQIYLDCQQEKLPLIVTADHGTVEEWLYPDGAINTGHTKNQVPFILCDFRLKRPQELKLKGRGELADVAPTVLDLLGLAKPREMTGQSLLADFPKAEISKFRSIKTKSSELSFPLVFLILDGWGYRENSYGNLIAEASTPNFDYLWRRFPHCLLEASGEAVGLPNGTVGNSEAGHLHLGAGRRLLLDRVKIDQSLADGRFFKNPILQEAMTRANLFGHSLHLMGIVSHYSSHGTVRHLLALLEMAHQYGLKKVFLHAFLGRRGERPESGVYYVTQLEEKTRELNCGQLVTVMGRYWALDREGNWDRIEKAYRALVCGEGYIVCPERLESSQEKID
ncbi:MAG: alkaline phosphatase family protein [Candidatus Aminicenantes bacterium]|nr:alkaline phosphatase family protein [Candidatus Aminicenantes bacterium]